MSQVLVSWVSGGRPDAGVATPAVMKLNPSKQGEFSQCLGRVPGAAGHFVGPGGGCEPEKLKESHSKREMAASEELLLGLALDAQSGVSPNPGDGTQYPGDPAGWLALLSPGSGDSGAGAALVAQPQTAPHRAGEVEVAELVQRWVRRMAVGGDGRRSALRLDIGAGRFAGAELTVVTEAGHVSVELSLPAATGEAGLAERLRGRLQGRGWTAEVAVR